MQNGFISRAFIAAFILALAAFPVAMMFIFHPAPNSQKALEQDKKSLATLEALALSVTPTPSPIPTPTSKVDAPLPSVNSLPTVSVKPTFIASIVQAQDVYNWTGYRSGSVLGDSFSFSYQPSWNVQYKKDATQKNAYQFLFSQTPKSQVMTVQVYNSASSVDEFIRANYPNKLSYEAFAKMGDVVVYRVTPKPELAATDPIYTTFGTRGLVLGKQHAYTISFDANSDHSLISLIEQIIWPTFSFK